VLGFGGGRGGRESVDERHILSLLTRADETQQLWLDYRSTGDPKARDPLILMYVPLVKYVARRLRSGLPTRVDEDDVVSSGLRGLVEAIELQHPAAEVKFETYATAGIKGQIIDGLRSMDWRTDPPDEPEAD
jgi:RNA polymerase sigma factor for flagellar operon FliA